MDHLISIKLPGGQSIEGPKSIPSGGLDFLGKTFGNALTIFLIAATFLSLGFLVWGGIQWSSSGGDKNKLGAARAKITWAIIGLVICFSTFLILSVIGGFFGVNLLNISTS